MPILDNVQISVGTNSCVWISMHFMTIKHNGVLSKVLDSFKRHTVNYIIFFTNRYETKKDWINSGWIMKYPESDNTAITSTMKNGKKVWWKIYISFKMLRFHLCLLQKLQKLFFVTLWKNFVGTTWRAEYSIFTSMIGYIPGRPSW